MSSLPSKKLAPETVALRAALAAARRAGRTREDIAAEVGVTPGALNQWATQHRPVPIKRAQALAAALGEPDPSRFCPSYSLLRTGEDTATYTLSMRERAVIDDFRQASEETKTVVSAALAAGAKQNARLSTDAELSERVDKAS